MELNGGVLQLSATDLVGHLSCRHLSTLDQAVARGQRPRPVHWDPLLEILWERGAAHERNFAQHLIESGLQVQRVDGFDISAEAIEATRSAMAEGVQVILQGALKHDRWVGRADVLRKVDISSVLGPWSYEVLDTKLARETKAGSILQLCLYTHLTERAQGAEPEYLYVVVPWAEFVPQQFRVADYAAYFRQVKQSFETSLERGNEAFTYPEPTEHCDTCRWIDECDRQRRADDHLSFVANITKVQIAELAQRGVGTMAELANLTLPLQWQPERGTAASYVRIREQARMQVQARECGTARFELFGIEPGFGLTRLPEPSPGDIFFDLEGDPFVGERGLEYLFGYCFADDRSRGSYRGEWALNRLQERRAFEDFIDFVTVRWSTFPNMHVYHFAPYEPAALKRLMGRYSSREEEMDRMLRANLFVDLYGVVCQTLRAGVESYSLKRLEVFYGFPRQVPLPDANRALATLHANMELGDVRSVHENSLTVVRGYNEDDCRSLMALRDWLEDHRGGLISSGTSVPRPTIPENAAPSENVAAWLARIGPTIEQLLTNVPDDANERTSEQHARWLLANVIDWNRREQKASWWEYFRLAELPIDDLLDERAGLSGLRFQSVEGGTVRAPVHRYSFLPQETDLRGGEDLRSCGGDKLGKVAKISFETLVVDIKKRKDTAEFHPEGIFAHKVVDASVVAEALLRIGEHVAANGIEGTGPYKAARDLLLRAPPPVNEQPLKLDGESTLQAALRLSAHLGDGILPIQGPPGSGKTFTAAQMICTLVQQGKSVGITANSHKVIRNLLTKVIAEADIRGIQLECCQKAEEVEEASNRLTFATSNEDLLGAIGKQVNVGAGTAWLWSRPDAFEVVDVLFVDEAAQMSLANVLAVSQAASTTVLIGDPQQLDQPLQGSHPEGSDVSALHHILGSEQTIASDRGLFLDETWRLHPDICRFTSELFYAGQLRPRPGLERQSITGSTRLSGAGLRYLPVPHTGNQNNSPEEASAIAGLVTELIAANECWIDADGVIHPITLKDILVITPYNAQVFELQKKLPGARVGTVDKFQGQEAPIAIYSTATSSHADAPRGMEFLYSLNRFNVATSRAKCLSMLVASENIFQVECKTPRQMQLANAFCRYLELARRI
jgi:predicted RecB family nuclease